MSFRLSNSKYAFQALPGYFVYTNNATSIESLPAIASNFGLEKGMTWSKLLEEIKAINAKAKETGTSCKLVYAARHGEGEHNVAEAKYGTKAWDDHWSLLTGDDKLHWGPDPTLTETGRQQAKDARKEWQRLLKQSDLPPLPLALFSSPMQRSAETLQLTFDDILWQSTNSNQKPSHSKDVRPLILECIREDFRDRHTCDERSKRSIIEKRWRPLNWQIDDNITEDDEIFASTIKESKEAISKRLGDALSHIWQITSSQDVINITSHSGAMQALFRACNHPDFKPKTGGMVPIVIQATEL